jgi:hypothetical protein
MLGGVGHMTRARWAAIITGLAFIAGGIALGAGPYHDHRAFEKAAYCATPAAQDDCITQVRMTVLSKSSYTTQDPDPNWPPPQPPPPPPQLPPPGPFGMAPSLTGRVLAAVPMSQTTHYNLTVRTADGRRHTFKVDAGIYNAAKPGATGLAEVWHGRIARLRVGAHGDDQWSYWSLGVAWLMGWLGVMLIVGWGLPLAEAPAGFVIGGWWAGIVLFGITHTWRPAVWAVPLLLAGSVLLLRMSATMSARRYRSARRA